MQIDDNIILGWLWKGLAVIGAAFFSLAGLLWKGDRARIKKDSERITELEIKVSHAITKPEVIAIAQEMEREFKDDHSGLEGKILSLSMRVDRVETGLRQEIHASHDSLQGSIDKVVNILLTRDASDRRRRGD